jgi:hypothetical protein
MAGADLTSSSSMAPQMRAAARDAVDEAFIEAFRLVMIGAAGLALGAAVVGSGIRQGA